MRRHQAGFSLIELMISMVIGLVVVGAVLAAYLGSGISSRNSRALAQITEDASVAMNVLRANIGMAGYSAVTGVNNGTFTRAFTAQSLRGCDGAFSDLDVGLPDLQCAGGGGSDSIAVAFQADAFNSVVSDAGAPLDCLGNGIAAVAPTVAYHRFYLQDGSLFCMGPGAAGGQALVNNISDLQIRYGVADPTPPGGGAAKSNQVVRYAMADDMADPDDFVNTVSVRVCLVIVSENEVMDAATPYRDCDGVEQTPNDRRLYRPFTSTIVLQNRLGGVR